MDMYDNVISVYSRQDAINDGMLVDISNEPETIKAGFKIPVVLTLHVYNYVIVPEKLEGSEDFRVRLWDTVYMATQAVHAAKRAGKSEADMELLTFKVCYAMENRSEEVELWLAFNASEGFTIMLPCDY